ncbi:terpinolene synthase [Acrasis kona]|uniref:Terpinolene synthase n=1 Tax=Acrasis kona TaxID=1008807 RepID=A0AAW2YWY6_9EUKA
MDLRARLELLEKSYQTLQTQFKNQTDEREAKRKCRVTLGQISYTLEDLFVERVLSPTRKGRERVRIVDVKNGRVKPPLSDTERQKWRQFETKVLRSGRFEGDIDYFIGAVKRLKNMREEDMKSVSRNELIEYVRNQFAEGKQYLFDDALNLIITDHIGIDVLVGLNDGWADFTTYPNEPLFLQWQIVSSYLFF